MSDSGNKPWSDNPNAPKISYEIYLEEKSYFAGTFIGAMLYGMLVVLFFKCMTALLSPAYRKGEGIKWGLVSYTVVMFSVATVLTGMDINVLSIAHIDNRDFPGVDGLYLPGPYGYYESIYFKPINLIPTAAFVLNNWLADGLLLYRCYVVYFMNLWVIAIPFLMFLSSMATGILYLCPVGPEKGGSALSISLAYFSISLSLNILLTLMIVARLIVYGRNIRAATGPPAGVNGLYKTIATMLIESSAMFAVTSVLYIGLAGSGNQVMDLFSPILCEVQVIAPLLIIQRVASKNALTGKSIVTGRDSSFKFGGQGESTGDSCTFPGGNHMSSVDGHGRNSGDLRVGVGTTIYSRLNEV